MASETKITYATLSADDDEMHRKFDAAITKVQGASWAERHRSTSAGKARPPRDTTDSTSPADTRVVVARVAAGTAEDVRDAVAAAKAAFPGWRRTPWQERAAILGRAASLVRERRFELSAWLILEMGKNRIEALGEIEELADLIDYYNEQMRANDGYVRPMGKLGPSDTQHQRAAPLRGVGGDRALELPLRAARRAHRRGAGHRQHRGGQAVVRHAAVGRAGGGDLPGGGAAARARSTC